MLKLRGCPKCRGDIILVSDMYGRYVNCLQCGFTKDLPDTLPQRRAVASEAPELQTIQRRAA